MPMRRLLVLLLGYLVGCKEAPSAGGGTPPGGRAPATPALLSELETLPVGLRVTHTPPEVRGPRGPNPDARDWRYRWFFRTEVGAIDRPLTITQFGILAWEDGKWVLPPDQSR